jgi:hypothetical protein
LQFLAHREKISEMVLSTLTDLDRGLKKLLIDIKKFRFNGVASSVGKKSLKGKTVLHTFETNSDS